MAAVPRSHFYIDQRKGWSLPLQSLPPPPLPSPQRLLRRLPPPAESRKPMTVTRAKTMQPSYPNNPNPARPRSGNDGYGSSQPGIEESRPLRSATVEHAALQQQQQQQQYPDSIGTSSALARPRHSDGSQSGHASGYLTSTMGSQYPAAGQRTSAAVSTAVPVQASGPIPASASVLSPAQVRGLPPAASSASASADTTWNPPALGAPAATSRRAFDPARDLNPTSPSPHRARPGSPTINNALRPNNAIVHDSHTGIRSATRRIRPADPLPLVQSRYRLEILEHPSAARASTYGDRDRRVINPPPILRMTLSDFDPDNESDRKDITWPYNIVYCTLWKATDPQCSVSTCVEVTAFDPSARPREGGLMGSLVANPFVVEAPNDQLDAGSSSSSIPVCYYVFHDLSCRTTGLYRLRFELTHIGEDFLRQGATSPTIAYAWSNPFEVYSAKDFPGVQPSSDLLIYLKRKGANVTIKKPTGNEVKNRRKSRTGASSGDEPMELDVKRANAFSTSDSSPTSARFPSSSIGFPEQMGPGG